RTQRDQHPARSLHPQAVRAFLCHQAGGRPGARQRGDQAAEDRSLARSSPPAGGRQRIESAGEVRRPRAPPPPPSFRWPADPAPAGPFTEQEERMKRAIITPAVLAPAALGELKQWLAIGTASED